jgi:hypothetical protein
VELMMNKEQFQQLKEDNLVKVFGKFIENSETDKLKMMKEFSLFTFEINF